jgi:hypothetical protein
LTFTMYVLKKLASFNHGLFSSMNLSSFFRRYMALKFLCENTVKRSRRTKILLAMTPRILEIWIFQLLTATIDSVQWYLFCLITFCFKKLWNFQIGHEATVVGQRVSTSKHQLTMAGKFKFLFCMESKFVSFSIS